MIASSKYLQYMRSENKGDIERKKEKKENNRKPIDFQHNYIFTYIYQIKKYAQTLFSAK